MIVIHGMLWVKAGVFCWSFPNRVMPFFKYLLMHILIFLIE